MPELRASKPEEVAFIKFNAKELSEKILETACAFLNSKAYYHPRTNPRNEAEKQHEKTTGRFTDCRKALEVRVSEVCSNLKCCVEYLQGIRFVKIEVTKSFLKKPVFYNEEFFIRTKYGNAVDWAKTFG